MTPEGQFTQAVNDVLASPLGARWPLKLRLNSGVIRKGSRFIKLCPVGTADRLLCRPGRVVWLELKVPGQKTERKRQEAQDAFGLLVRSIGHEYHRITSVDELLFILEN